MKIRNLFNALGNGLQRIIFGPAPTSREEAIEQINHMYDDVADWSAPGDKEAMIDYIDKLNNDQSQ